MDVAEAAATERLVGAVPAVRVERPRVPALAPRRGVPPRRLDDPSGLREPRDPVEAAGREAPGEARVGGGRRRREGREGGDGGEDAGLDAGPAERLVEARLRGGGDGPSAGGRARGTPGTGPRGPARLRPAPARRSTRPGRRPRRRRPARAAARGRRPAGGGRPGARPRPRRRGTATARRRPRRTRRPARRTRPAWRPPDPWRRGPRRRASPRGARRRGATPAPCRVPRAAPARTAGAVPGPPGARATRRPPRRSRGGGGPGRGRRTGRARPAP